MAKLYADAAGTLLRLVATELHEKIYPDPPPGTAFTVTFDAATNPTLVDQLNTNWNGFTMPGGVLTRGGTAVTVSPAGQTETDRTAIGAIVTKLRNEQNLTQTETRQLLRYLLRRVG